MGFFFCVFFFCRVTVTKMCTTRARSYVKDVLRLIRGQDAGGDLLAVGEADGEGHFFCGNLLRLLWEAHGGGRGGATTHKVHGRVLIAVGPQRQ